MRNRYWCSLYCTIAVAGMLASYSLFYPVPSLASVRLLALPLPRVSGWWHILNGAVWPTLLMTIFDRYRSVSRQTSRMYVLQDFVAGWATGLSVGLIASAIVLGFHLDAAWIVGITGLAYVVRDDTGDVNDMFCGAVIGLAFSVTVTFGPVTGSLLCIGFAALYALLFLLLYLSYVISTALAIPIESGIHRIMKT